MCFGALKLFFCPKPAINYADLTPEERAAHDKKYGGPPLNLTSREMRRATYSNAGVLGGMGMALGS